MPEPAAPYLQILPKDVHTMGYQTSIKKNEKYLRMLTSKL